MYSRSAYPSVIHSRFKDVNRISQRDTDLLADAPHIRQVQADGSSVKLQLFHIHPAFYQLFGTE